MKNRVLAAALLVATCGAANAAGFTPSFYVGLHSDYNKLSFDEVAISKAAQQASQGFFATQLESMRAKQVLKRRHDQDIAQNGFDLGAPFAQQGNGPVGGPTGIEYIDGTVTTDTIKYFTDTQSLKRKQATFSPVLGLRFSEFFAMELSYTHMNKFTGDHVFNVAAGINSGEQELTKFKFGTNTTPGGHADNSTEADGIVVKAIAEDITTSGVTKHNYEIKVNDIYHLDLVAALPLHHKISLLSTIGVGHYKVKASGTLSNRMQSAGSEGVGIGKDGAWSHDAKEKEQTYSSTKHKVAVRMGLGVEFKLTKAVSLQAMARYQKLDMKMDFAGKHDVSVLKNNVSFGMGLTYAL
ncbi:MAG: hypothetical protein COC15_01060 [Legionellales bacterium]|nr:MAG: hypothetical protein COC15_01060 [Legionellales bacterium]